jgi:hypothetical protein
MSDGMRKGGIIEREGKKSFNFIGNTWRRKFQDDFYS